MAFFDDANKAIVLRLIYAGPPLSGKTATLYALSRQLLGTRHSNAVFTPEEADGRTLFFDWLEYSGGLFQGRQIRCQVVSVPGQRVLFRRRKALLESADVVVFVVDAHVEQSDLIRKFYDEMKGYIAKPDDQPPVGIIVQANKSDLPEALDSAQLRDLLDDSPNIAIVSTVAIAGTGIREAFVQAVGLGLARAREVQSQGNLESGNPEITSGKDLLKHLRQLEDQHFGEVAKRGLSDRIKIEEKTEDQEKLLPQQLGEILERELDRGAERSTNIGDIDGIDRLSITAEGSGERDPRIPDYTVGAGMVWPSVGGRIILNEISKNQPSLERLPDMAWSASISDQWRMLSLSGHRYDSEYRAREEVLRLARIHAGYKGLLSEHRCITCAATGFGDWRIWQIVRCDDTLSDKLKRTLQHTSSESIAAELLGVAQMLRIAADQFTAAGFPRLISLDAMSVSHGSPVYVGFLIPTMDALSPAEQATKSIDALAFIQSELGDTVRELSQRNEIVPQILRQLEASKGMDRLIDRAAETLMGMFLRHG